MSQLVDAEGDDPPGESSSAMHSKDCKLAALWEALDTQNQELLEAREALHQIQEGLQQETELSKSKGVLEKEKRKIRKIWWEKCNL